MSKNKLLLRLLVMLSSLLGISAYVLACLSKSGVADPSFVQPLVLYGFAGIFVIFGSAVFLSFEFIRSSRSRFSSNYTYSGLSLSEAALLTQWCPRWLLISSVLLAATAFFLMPFGRTHWSIGQEFTNVHATAFSACEAVFYFASIPVLASAARMPGSFLVRFSALRNAKRSAIDITQNPASAGRP